MATQPLEPRLSAVEQAQARTLATLDQTAAAQAEAQDRFQATLDRLSAAQDRFQANLERMAAAQAEAQDRFQTNLDRLSAAQDRTQTNLDRLSAAQDRTQANLDQMSAENQSFHANNQVAVDQIRAAVQSIEASDRRMDERLTRSERQWGELANKLGTLTEDIVLPGIPTVFRSIFGEEGTVELAVRVRRRHRLDPGRMEEFDAVASGGDILLVAESKSRLKPEYIGEFRDKLARSRDFLPEAAGKKVVGLVASFYLDPSLVTAGERQGLIMVGLGTGLLQVLNTQGFVPGQF